MYTKAPTSKQMPLNIVGSTTYGRYPKISTENTYNMFIIQATANAEIKVIAWSLKNLYLLAKIKNRNIVLIKSKI